MNDWVMQLLLAGVAIAVVPTVLSLLARAWRTRRLKGGPESRCRRCGHVVDSQSDQACHNCAADLRKVGVFSPVIAKRPIKPVGLIVGTGMAFAALALLAGPMLSKRLPKWGTTYTASARIATADLDAQANQNIDYIEIIARGDRGIAYRSPTVLDVTWWGREKGAMRWKVSAYPKGAEWEIKSRAPDAVSTSDAFDYTTALGVIQRGGIDPQSAWALVLADNMVSTVRRFQRAQFGGDPDQIGRAGYTPPVVTHQGSQARTLVIAMIVWFPVWSVLAIILTRRYRRQAARARAQEQGALDFLLVLESRLDEAQRAQTQWSRDHDWRSSDISEALPEESLAP